MFGCPPKDMYFLNVACCPDGTKRKGEDERDSRFGRRDDAVHAA